MRAARLLLAAALCIAGAASAAPACSASDAAAATKAIYRIEGWAALHKAWKDYGRCDSGEVADLYTDALLRLMVDWKDMGTLADAMAKDAPFREFIIAHLRSEAAKDDRPMVYSRAKASCPSGLGDFCTEIATAAKAPSAAKQLELDLSPLQPIGSAPAKDAGKPK
jgi:hypothetical protein